VRRSLRPVLVITLLAILAAAIGGGAALLGGHGHGRASAHAAASPVAPVAPVMTVAPVATATGPSGPSLGSNCAIDNASGGGYTLVLENNGTQTVEVTGFVVTFENAAGVETGSDTEPGNGTVNGDQMINMQDWLTAGQSWTYNVTGTLPSGAVSASCALATWYSGS